MLSGLRYGCFKVLTPSTSQAAPSQHAVLIVLLPWQQQKLPSFDSEDAPDTASSTCSNSDVDEANDIGEGDDSLLLDSAVVLIDAIKCSCAFSVKGDTCCCNADATPKPPGAYRLPSSAPQS